jgi:hypothetical protein
MRIKVNEWKEIDFTEVDPNLDEFEVDGKLYKMSDFTCHVCWEGGTVMQSENEFFCIRCENQLNWHELPLQFYNEKQAQKESFLLPVHWDEEQLNQWKEDFVQKRNLELKFRDFLLNNPEGGEFYDNE